MEFKPEMIPTIGAGAVVGLHLETKAQEIARLQREIGERQARLQFLVCGDPRIGVAVQATRL